MGQVVTYVKSSYTSIGYMGQEVTHIKRHMGQVVTYVKSSYTSIGYNGARNNTDQKAHRSRSHKGQEVMHTNRLHGARNNTNQEAHGSRSHKGQDLTWI